MSKFGGLFKGIASLFGVGNEKFNLPDVVIPATDASATTDTGATIALGQTAADIANQRVSGRSVKRKVTGGIDVLGGLGQSGLSI